MMENLSGIGLTFGILILALGGLLLSAEKLVAGSEELGLSLGVPPFLMGLTVIAVGTSLPELVTAFFAILDGSGELVVGTVMGSNIANILLILGVAAFYAKEMNIDWDLLHGDLPVLFGSVLLLGFIIYPVSTADLALFREVVEQAAGSESVPLGSSSIISMPESIILISGYLLYLYYYTINNPNLEAAKDDTVERPHFRWQSGAWIGFGLIGVPIGAAYTVNAAVEIATFLDVGKGVIAASMIAIGTSLPELVVSISAVRRKNYEMALGNVTGSNIFNTFIVMGVPALVAPFVGGKVPLGVGEPSVLTLQFPYYAATVVLFLVIVLDKKLTRTEGLLILICYALFIAKLFSIV